ncbi:aldo/keto reductase [Novosphingobium sp. MW5]|nr:aldo/keto reductase [Novosphingobium sp. MW5]
MKRLLAGRQLNPFGLGCMGLTHGYGVPPAPEDAAKVLEAALDLGVDHFDTANIYGAGRCETLIGNTLSHRRSEFFLASKTGIMFDGPKRGTNCHPDAVLKSLDESLARLKTDHLDLFYLHRFDRDVPIPDSIGALVRAKEAGKILSYGVSEWSAEHIREAHAVHPMAAVQTEYSLWTRNVEIAVLDTCKALGIAMVAFSPLGRGALANGIRDRATLLEGDIRYTHPRFDEANWPENLGLIDRFNAIATREGVTPAQLSLAWVLSRGDHVHVIPGTTSIAHLTENMARQDWQPDAALLEEVGALINQQTVHGPRYPAAMQKTIDTEEFS